MPVLINGSKKLTPAPFCRIGYSIKRSADGTARERVFKITFTGKLMAHKGSPDYQGVWWTTSGYPPDTPDANLAEDKRLATLEAKAGALAKEVNSAEGKWWEVQPWDGSAGIKFQPLVAELELEQGLWFNEIAYTITVETPSVTFGSTVITAQTQSACPPEESWTVEPTDDTNRAYRLSHTVSAQAQKKFNSDGTLAAEGWQIAKAIVTGDISLAGASATSKLGYESDKLLSTDVLNLSSNFAPYNMARHVQIDEAAGKYSVTESWLCFNTTDDNFGDATAGNVIEELEVESRYAADSGLSRVLVKGSIRGLRENNSTTFALTKTAWDNAQDRFAQVNVPATLLNRAQTYSGITLNPDPLDSSIERNPITGVIGYSVEYYTRPKLSNEAYLSELYTVTFDDPSDVFAAIAIPDRPAGPLLQPMGTITEKSITIVAEIVVKVAYADPQTYPTMPTYDALGNVLGLLGSTPSQIFVRNPKRNWVPRSGRFSQSATYVYQ